MTALDRLRDHAEANNLHIDWANRYGEPQYAVKGEYKEDILLADWNEFPEDLQDALEKEGYDLLWEGEWYLDHDASTVWRSEPDSYWWRPSIAYTEKGVLTPDHDPEDWFDAFHNEPRVMPEAAPVPEDMRLVGHIRYTGNAVELERSLRWELVIAAECGEDTLFRYEGSTLVAMFTRTVEEESDD